MVKNDSQLALKDGSSIAVVGGGPSGSFFSIFALKMASMVGKRIDLTIFEPKDFSKEGPAGCNRCGGIVSELLVQTLAVEGINLPAAIVQRGINSYRLHTGQGSAYIATPALEKTIATVYRGGGPKGEGAEHKESFDNFLLKLAVREGAVLKPIKVDRIACDSGRPVLFSANDIVAQPDLVVGAVGVKSSTTGLFEDAGFGYKPPATATASIAEIQLDEGLIAERFGSSIHFFLLPIRNIKFAAVIPKGSYLTVCIIGKEINARVLTDFMENPVVKKVLPAEAHANITCRCLPKLNINAAQTPFADRLVICGDAGSTRLYKDGLNAAYLMGKAAAKTAVFHGVGKRHFLENYYPVYKSLAADNHYGRYLYLITDIYRRTPLLCRGLLAVIRKEQSDPSERKILSAILWNMFTGNERYKNIFPLALDLMMHLNLWKEFLKIIVRRELWKTDS